MLDTRPTAAALAAAVAARDPDGLATLLASTVTLRALRPGGPVAARGSTDVAALLIALVADFDRVEVVESRTEPVEDRLLLHHRLQLSTGERRWTCTQTAVCAVDDGRLTAIDLLCSGFRRAA